MSYEDEIADLQAQVEALQREATELDWSERPLRVPSATEFVLSPEFLARDWLFPRQATLLKVLFLESDAFTAYDLDVIDEWRSGFAAHTDEHGGGRWFEPVPGPEFSQGTPPDLLDRIDVMRQRDRPSFRHLNLVAGRRAGKGEITAMAIAYRLWQLLALYEPQRAVNAARRKTLTVDIFAATAEQARANVFLDVVRIIVSSTCFRPFICTLTRDRLVLATPFDLDDPQRVRAGTIEIAARETTMSAARGQTSVIQVFDEMAFVTSASSKAPAEEIYGSATPALDQARGWGMIITASSPYQRAGQFHALHRQACEIDPETGTAAYPEMVTMQFPSWALYLDAERAALLPMVSHSAAAESEWLGGRGEVRCFPDPGDAPIVDDADLRQKQRADPARFRVENGGQWAEVQDAFLERSWVERVFEPIGDLVLEKRNAGIARHDYIMHIDPSVRRDATAYVIAHAETIAGERYVIIDSIRRWKPAGADLDWNEIYDQIESDIRAFAPSAVTIDQFGGTFIINEIRRRTSSLGGPRQLTIHELSHTRSGNLALADTFRDAVRRGLLRSYPDSQLRNELLYLQDVNGAAKAPTTGPVTTDDVAVCAMVAVSRLLDRTAHVREALANAPLGVHPGFADPDNPTIRQLSAITRGQGQRARYLQSG